MPDKVRTTPVYVKVRPSLHEAMKVDAYAKGQSITVWAERAFMARLGMLEDFDLVEEPTGLG
jgi:predicted HicB family RNase H-like nuclease